MLPTPCRGLGEGRGHRRAGAVGLEDLVHDTDLHRALQTAGEAVVLLGELLLDLLAVRLVDLEGSTGQVVRAALTDPVVWVLLAYGALGLALYTVALGRGAVGPVVGVLAVTETLAPGLLGLVLLGDGVRAGWWPGLLLGLALALGGVVVLARSPAQASLAGDDGVAAPPLKRL